jgi:hypothetical protein
LFGMQVNVYGYKKTFYLLPDRPVCGINVLSVSAVTSRQLSL